MIGIIWFIVVLYIVIRCVGNAKKNGQAKPDGSGQANRQNTYRTGGKWTNPQAQAARSTRQQTMPAMQPQAQTARSTRQQTAPAMQPDRAQQPKKSGAAYNRPARAAQPRKNTDNSILQKAKANAAEQFDVDTLADRGRAVLDRVPSGDEIMRDKAYARHIHSAHETDSHDSELRNQPGLDDFDTYHLVDEVNDLIVKGYSGNLEFERDFLAEAADMLNRMYG